MSNQSNSKPELALKEAAKKEIHPSGFRVEIPGDGRYNEAREISNSYFDYSPSGVAFPRSVQQVAFLLKEHYDLNQKLPEDEKIPLRIMSGGHHHEGMSSANKALVIRLSEFGTIEFSENKTHAWIPAGMKLGAVYAELSHHGKMIPGGGCFNVNVGGLTQGGGWGMNARKYGLTCDNIKSVEVVLGNGEIIVASEKDHSDIFWAIKGGGGGNFGIVTRFLFHLRDKSKSASQFRLGWTLDKLEAVTKRWLQVQKDFPRDLTSFLRVTVRKTEPGQYKAPQDYPVYVSGNFHGKAQVLRDMIQDQLTKDLAPKSSSFIDLNGYENEEILKALREIDKDADIVEYYGADILYSSVSAQDFMLHAYDIHGRIGEGIEQSDHCLVLPPTSNCGAPHPHKVSSAFPVEGPLTEDYYGQLALELTSYVNRSKDKMDPAVVRSYMTFHSMGGAIAEIPDSSRAFAFGKCEFLMQFQSWWNYPNGEKGAACRKDINWQQSYLDWVTEFRRELADKNLIEGAFINFVDKDLPVKATDPLERKLELLRYYYGNNLDRLRKVKSQYDPEYVFEFPMSIPLSESF